MDMGGLVATTHYMMLLLATWLDVGHTHSFYSLTYRCYVAIVVDSEIDTRIVIVSRS